MPPLWVPALLLAAAVPMAPDGAPVADFELRDPHDAAWRLADCRARLVVLAFLGTECPLAQRYADRLAELAREFGPHGVAVVALDANRNDSAADIARFVRAHRLPYPVLRDPGARVADQLGALRTTEVFLLDEQRVVRYRGRIDDQYAVAVHRAKPTRRDLAEAIAELLDGKPVATPATEASGCLLDRGSHPGGGAVTYCRDVAPVLQRRCQVCHRPGQIGPFSLTSYQEAAGWAENIREVVRAGRMPPWHADPQYGKFANDPRLTDEERRILDDWVADGAAEGDPGDLPPPAAFAEGWNIGEPDAVIAIPEPMTIPAEGVMEYQVVEVDPGFRQDKWVRAAEVRPGNRAVVHHCNVFLKPPGTPPLAAGESAYLAFVAGVTLGTPPLLLPDGMAKRIPAGWHLVFILHYTPLGSVQTDQTSIGLAFADPKTVRKEVVTDMMQVLDLCIPPHAADHRVERSGVMEHDVLLLAMYPHMHLRGKSFRYEVDYPDGTTEVLLDVPRYDFAWQNRYVLAEPKRLPRGTVLRCVAVYDNSANNPANPDPEATVRTGPQSWDEMFNGYYELALADQDLTRPAWFGPLPLVVVAAAAAAYLLWRGLRFRTAPCKPSAGRR